MKLIQELSTITGYTQNDLKTSDGSNAGANDTVSKPVDVKFSLMRNVINSDGGITGSDVNDYLERAGELNDEVDTIGFVIETDDDDYIKIYVNASQADEFEAEMAKLLGLEDDPEAAINTLAQKYDIVDVVWPKDPEPDTDADDVNIDNAADAVAPADGESDDDLTATLADTEVVPTGDGAADSTSTDVSAGAEEEPPTDGEANTEDDEDKEDEGDEGDEDEDGKPKKKKKEKDLSKLAAAAKKNFTEGRYVIEARVGDRQVGFAPFSFDTLAGALSAVKELHVEGATLSIIDRQSELNESYDELPETDSTTQGDTDMTIGSKFLSRVLNEAAPEDRDGVRDGMNIPLDSQYRALVTQLKRPYEKKLVALYAMVGIPGRYVNTVDGIKERVQTAGDMLRTNGAVRNAFNEFYNALATAKGFAPQETKESVQVDEAKGLKRGSFIQKKMETILTMLGLPEELVTTEGPGVAAPVLYRTAKMIDQDANLQAAMNKLAIRMGIKAVDTAAPVAEEAVFEAKAGVAKKYNAAVDWYTENYFSKTDRKKDFSLPLGVRQDGDEMFFCTDVTTDEWESEKSVCAKMTADGKITKSTYRDYKAAADAVKYPPLSKADKKAAKTMKESVLAEEVDVGNDEFFQKVVALAMALGIPERNFQFQRPTLIKSMREKKMSLGGRGMIESRMDQLLAMIEKNTRKTPGAEQE